MNYYLKALRNYAVFSGRANRREFWVFVSINSLFMLGLIYGLPKDVAAPIVWLFQVATLIPLAAVLVRRLHDTDRAGWWILVPVLNLVFACMEGTQAANRYGPDPEE